jgi:protein-disulfide isomerase
VGRLLQRALGRAACYAGLAVVVAACGAAGDVEEIKATQRQILRRLAALEKNDRALLASLRSGRFGRTPDPERIYDIPIGESPTRGPEDAAVVFVQFADFQCPFSASSSSLVEQVLTAYPKEVRLVAKQFPLALLHEHARNAARAALAAHRQGKFWEMYEMLFKNQQALDHESLKRYARKIGIDERQFETDMASPEVESALRADIAEGRQAGVTGTPTFFIDGKRVMSRSFESVRLMVEEALNHTNEPP